MNRRDILGMAAMLLSASPAQASYFPSLPVMALMFLTPLVVVFVPVWAMTRRLDDRPTRWQIRLVGIGVFMAVFLVLGFSGIAPDDWTEISFLVVSMFAAWALTLVLVRRAL